jgi:hypothetical protein
LHLFSAIRSSFNAGMDKMGRRIFGSIQQSPLY